MGRTLFTIGILFCTMTVRVFAQDIALFEQFNGRYDYTAIGNTLNTVENGLEGPCTILTSASAELSLSASQSVTAAYLYWAGSGSGDFNISVNNIPVSAERTFSDALDDTRIFFAAFADITAIIATQGSGNYTISEFDLTNTIAPYCASGTNFGGWAITVIYEDSALPLNQVNVYDGLQSVPTFLSITLDNLNVLDTENAKIGFVAWEGDQALAVNEQLSINNNVISNPPLNPVNNAFNGTNSFTGATNLYNMDIDVYNIQNNISIGDTSATISLNSGQDFVMINNVITVLNSQLPDATISFNDYSVSCGLNDVELSYTVNNFDSTDVLPENTPIAFYVNNLLIGQSYTEDTIAIGGSENATITLTLPDGTSSNPNIVAVVDDNGTMVGEIIELNELNNTASVNIILLVPPEIITLPNLLACNEGFESATYNLFDALESIPYNESDVSFFTSLADLQAYTNVIIDPYDYIKGSNPETIFIRMEDVVCYDSYQMDLTTENCPPRIPSGFSPNGDNFNDWFNIQGLYNIFTEHELQIYNRWGVLIFKGNNTTPWDGKANKGVNNQGSIVPVGTYYYILYPNDSEYQPMTGWVYVNY